MATLGNNFYPKLVQISSEVGMIPEDLIAVMISESGMNAGASNPNGGATGLIQFMPNTLKGLNFKGTSKDFGQLEGESQLDWIKKYILNQTKMNGGPFTSAAQYYVANFFPVALKLPGIRKGDPSTVFVEENPKTVTVNGSTYSKKYYDIGIKLHPKSEISAYKANPGFHGSTPGAITYADMIKQIDKNKRNPKYKQALLAMTQQTNYSPSKTDTRFIAHQTPAAKPVNTNTMVVPPTFNSILDKFVGMVAASQKNFIVKNANLLPKNKFLVRLSSDDIVNSIEFARILSMAAKEDLQANVTTFADQKNVDVVLEVAGEGVMCFEALNQLNAALVDTFKIATKKLGGINVKSEIFVNSNSNLTYVTSKVATSNYRQFLLKFAGANE